MRGKKAAPLPEVVSAEVLADMTGYTVRRIFQFVDEGVLPRPAKKGEGYPLALSVRRICEQLKKEIQGDSAQKAKDAARQQRADADRSELNTGKELGVLMFAADAKRLWSDALVRIREKILRIPGLNMKQRVAVAEAIQAIKLRTSEEEDDEA